MVTSIGKIGLAQKRQSLGLEPLGIKACLAIMAQRGYGPQASFLKIKSLKHVNDCLVGLLRVLHLKQTRGSVKLEF